METTYTTAIEGPVLYTVPQAARILGVNFQVLYTAIEEGTLPTAPVAGKVKLVKGRDLLKWQKARTTQEATGRAATAKTRVDPA